MTIENQGAVEIGLLKMGRDDGIRRGVLGVSLLSWSSVDMAGVKGYTRAHGEWRAKVLLLLYIGRYHHEICS